MQSDRVSVEDATVFALNQIIAISRALFGIFWIFRIIVSREER